MIEVAGAIAIVVVGLGFGLCFTALGFQIAVNAWRELKRH